MFELEMSDMIDGEFTWEIVPVNKTGAAGIHVQYDDIYCTYTLNKLSKSKGMNLFVYLGLNIMRHLDVKVGNKLMLLQDKKDIHNYLLVKSENGKKIMANGSKTSNNIGVLNYKLNREGLGAFKKTKVSYFKNVNGTVRILLPKIKVKSLDDDLKQTWESGIRLLQG